MDHSTQRFDVLKEKLGSLITYRLQDNESGEFVSILPFLGGSINRLVLHRNNEFIDVIDGYTSIAEIEETLTNSFKGCSLFPFPNRVAQGSYIFEGTKYHLSLNFFHENNAIHGLVYDKEFVVLRREGGDFECVLVLCYQASGGLKGYPFKFRLQQKYCLSENSGFACTTTVTNLSPSTIPIGHGWHPYFKIGTGRIDGLYLQMPAKAAFSVDQQGIPTGKTVGYQKFRNLTEIGNTTFDDCFRLDTNGHRAEVILSHLTKALQLKIWLETGRNKYNYLQLYTPPSRLSIAIEPMSCAPDAFNNREGLVILSPAESLSLSWGVSLKGQG